MNNSGISPGDVPFHPPSSMPNSPGNKAVSNKSDPGEEKIGKLFNKVQEEHVPDSQEEHVPDSLENAVPSQRGIAADAGKSPVEYEEIPIFPDTPITSNFVFAELREELGEMTEKSEEFLKDICSCHNHPNVQSVLLFGDIRDTNHTSEQLEGCNAIHALIHELDNLAEFKKQLESEWGDSVLTAAQEGRLQDEIEKVNNAIAMIATSLRLKLSPEWEWEDYRDVLDVDAAVDFVSSLQIGQYLYISLTVCSFTNPHEVGIKIAKNESGELCLELTNTGESNQIHNTHLANSFLGERGRYTYSYTYPPALPFELDKDFLNDLLLHASGTSENPVGDMSGLYNFLKENLGDPQMGRSHKVQKINDCYAKSLATVLHGTIAPGDSPSRRDPEEELLYLKYRSFVLHRCLEILERGDPSLNPHRSLSPASDFEMEQSENIVSYIKNNVILKKRKEKNIPLKDPLKAIYKEIVHKLSRVENKAKIIQKHRIEKDQNASPSKEEIFKNPSLLEFASDDIKRERIFILELLQRDGLALRFAAKSVRDDEDLVAEACMNVPGAFFFASKELRSNPQFIFDLIVATNSMAIYQNCIPQLKENPEFILHLMENFSFDALIGCIPKSLKDDRRFILKLAANYQEKGLEFASDRLKDNPRFMKRVAEFIGGKAVIPHLAERLKRDKSL